MDIGPPELIIILVIVIVLFGVGRIGKLGGELGSGIRAFREGLKGKDEDGKKDDAIKGNSMTGEPIPPPSPMLELPGNEEVETPMPITDEEQQAPDDFQV
jgi:sec-independent protein translocase protein TatA